MATVGVKGLIIDADDKPPTLAAIDCSICVRNLSVQIRPPCWIFDIQNFWRSTVIAGRFCIFVRDFHKFYVDCFVSFRTTSHIQRDRQTDRQTDEHHHCV